MTKKQTCPKCGKELVGLEYTHDSKFHYDGVSELMCPTGHYRIGRWCGRTLTDHEREPKDCMVPFAHPMEMIIEQGSGDTL
jgi:hypothetical protein